MCTQWNYRPAPNPHFFTQPTIATHLHHLPLGFRREAQHSPFVPFDFGGRASAATAKESLNGEEARGEHRRRQGK